MAQPSEGIQSAEQDLHASSADSGFGDAKPNGSACHLLLLCNQVLKKRCQEMAAAIQSGGRKYNLSCRLKCITYIEETNAYSVSVKTEPLLQSANLILCVLRMMQVQKLAMQQLREFLPQRSTSSLALLQFVGDSYVVQHADACGNTRLDSDAAFVDFFLRCWLAESLEPRPPPQQLQFVSVGSSEPSGAQMLHHRLLARRYTLDVEYQRQRRRSMYRVACDTSPVRAQRCQSLAGQLSGVGLDLLDESNDAGGDDGQLPGNQLIVCHSRSNGREASMCLNHLASSGAPARSLNDFADAGAGAGRRSLLRLRHRLVRHRRLLASAMRLPQAADAVFLLFCRRHTSKLLAAFLAASAELRRRSLPAPACLLVLTDPTDSPQLPRVADCRVDVFYSANGLRGIRLLRELMPSLLQLARRIERHGAAA